MSSQRDEWAELPTALEQAKSLTSLGDRPLIVVTAGLDPPAGWMEAQEGMTKLSSNVVHRLIADATHTSLIMSEAGAAASSKAILNVVASVRTGAALATR
jgi:hypothetical protein